MAGAADSIRRSHPEGAAAEYVITSLSVFPMLVLIRLFELVLVRSRHVIPPGVLVLTLRGLLADLAVTLVVGAVLALPILGVSLLSRPVARTAHRVALVIFIAIAAALSEYFAVTYVPLGADFFGYNWSEIRETTASSGGGGIGTILPLLVVAALAWWVTGFVRRFRMSHITAVLMLAIFVSFASSAMLRRALAPGVSAFPSQSVYVLSTNKAGYFAGATFAHFLGSISGAKEALTGYPLLRAANDPDVLGPLLNIGRERPNIVFVIVEGLGRDFVGPGARYGGFTPFLDSLTQNGLYWENFLSSSGRTFGVLPGLLGSLPYGSSGFMSLGARMPNHISLVSLLGKQGYQTDYFTGGDKHFDLIDVFMEREGVEHLVDQTDFPTPYVKAPASVGGASWGFSDGDLFKRSLEILGPGTAKPRLDVYLTMTSHEPFIPPRAAEYHARFAARLKALPFDSGRRTEIQRYEDVFSTLLYTDESIASLVHAYERRPEFARTIFIITGDHRLIPVPEQSALDRFRVPFIIFSPMVKAPRTIRAVSSHLDVTPSLLAFLRAHYGVTVPDTVAWIGTAIDTSTAFRSTHAIPLMRTKNGLDAFLDGTRFVATGEAYDIDDSLHLRPAANATSAAREKLDRFVQVNAYVTTKDRLYRGSGLGAAELAILAREDSAFAALRLDSMDVEKLFILARATALTSDRARARVILRKLLHDAPNDQDARTLVGRTFAWDKAYDSARVALREVLRRGPQYVDAYAALADVEMWSGAPARGLTLADSGLQRAPRSADLLLHRARALEMLNRPSDELAALDALTSVDPSNAEGAKLRARLKR